VFQFLEREKCSRLPRTSGVTLGPNQLLPGILP